MKFRKKPVVIDAIQFTGENQKEIQEFAKGHVQLDDIYRYITIQTPIGNMAANPGDWIINSKDKGFYPAEKTYFERTYEPINETAQDMKIDVVLYAKEDIAREAIKDIDELGINAPRTPRPARNMRKKTL